MKKTLIIFLIILFNQSTVFAPATAHEHFSLDFIPEDFVNVRGFIFGIVHTGLLVIGYYTGWSVNRVIKVASNGYIAGLSGALGGALAGQQLGGAAYGGYGAALGGLLGYFG